MYLVSQRKRASAQGQLFLAFIVLHVYLGICTKSRRLFQVFEQKINQEQQISESLFARTCNEAYKANPKGRESQSCSLGSTKPFVGPLATWDDVKAMLQARSHKGEIIVTHETRTDIAIQWQWRMMRMGYAHTVIVARGEHACQSLRDIFGDFTGCVWFRHAVPCSGWSSFTAGMAAATGNVGGGLGSAASGGGMGTPLLSPGQVGIFLESPFYWRLHLAVMILRVGGYNQLVVDTDTMLQDDFYWWTSQPDYKDYHFLSQFDGMGTLNVGVMYFRRAPPDGPTAWVMADSLLRNIRWCEQPQLLTARNSTHLTCWDQSVVSDAAFSALVGRPLFWRCLQVRQMDQSWNVREDGQKLFDETNDKLLKAALRRKVFDMTRPGPRCHASVVGEDGLWAQEGVLTLPHFRGEWPEQLGGQALGTLGPVASAFVNMLREAGTTMWPDLEDPATAAAAAAVPSERFSYFSRHLVCDWSACGQNGMYQPALTPEQEPCVVIGHLVVSPDTTPGKRFQFMVNGHYNMRLAQARHGPGGGFFATNAKHSSGATHYGTLRAGAHHARRGQEIPLPKVIALAPSALSPGPSPSGSSPSASGPLVLGGKEHLVAVVEALSSVATAAGRTLGLPRLSCDYPWMHRDGFPYNGSHYVPWRYMVGEAFAPYGPTLDHLSCEWLAWVQPGCLHGPIHMERPGHGHFNPHPSARLLLSYEMLYLLQLLPAADREPAAAAASGDSVGRAEGAGDGGGGGGGGNLISVPASATAGADGVYNMTLAQLEAQLEAIDSNRTVIWMEKPMRVTDLTNAQRSAQQLWVQQCCGLNWPRSFNHICFWPF